MAAIRKLIVVFSGALAKSPPIGTPFLYPTWARLVFTASALVNAQPPKNRRLIRLPVVAYTSFRFMASQMPSRVFSVDQTAV